MTESKNARDIFRTAYENRYTWDANFPGYKTDIKLIQGDRVDCGQIEVAKDLSVKVLGIEDEKVAESLYNHMRDVITHRKRSSFEQAHGKSTFTLGAEDNNGAVEILVSGDAMGSNYKVKGKEISQVSRVMGPMAFTINTYECLDTGEGYIATGYNAIFRDAKTNDLKAKREFRETYEKFGDYYLPTYQKIETLDKDGVNTLAEFNFTNIQLSETLMTV
jgi:hypothetical protein